MLDGLEKIINQSEQEKKEGKENTDSIYEKNKL